MLSPQPEAAAGRRPDRDGANPAVTAAVLNYDGRHLLEVILPTLAAQTYKPLELLVVDNGSRDDSRDYLAANWPDVRVEAIEVNAGVAPALNRAVASTEGPFVILLNNDLELEPDALEVLITRLVEDPRIGIAAPLLFNSDGSLQVSGYRRFPNLLTHFVELSVPAGYLFLYVPRLNPYALSPDEMLVGGDVCSVAGPALAVRRSAFEDAGPLDEGFYLYMEETEWEERVRAAGWRIETVPRARVTHLIRGGGDAALSPSPHYLASAARYLHMRGYSRRSIAWVTRAALATSFLLLAVRSLVPVKRRRTHLRRSAYGRLLRLSLSSELESIGRSATDTAT
jgi:GT2 family glycosyltransferase